MASAASPLSSCRLASCFLFTRTGDRVVEVVVSKDQRPVSTPWSIVCAAGTKGGNCSAVFAARPEGLCAPGQSGAQSRKVTREQEFKELRMRASTQEALCHRCPAIMSKRLGVPMSRRLGNPSTKVFSSDSLPLFTLVSPVDDTGKEMSNLYDSKKMETGKDTLRRRQRPGILLQGFNHRNLQH
ncbi:hypothetical protein BDK51DRAFT_33189 [Blyttiomyces helicus]|uniref:Uncharacterized protein n=1 Tax=Blyttiomyces helicus TaxID=388810 RepID=A0A4P9WI41_9FUNG|nr:hypothetical protein BDK51DRAFT_33189 [Blyttiomyces helicus]|eukprot:RKO91533.1 hypothetical protein BDK51DRAFT_33189 [Blyttiomyces helicus]